MGKAPSREGGKLRLILLEEQGAWQRDGRNLRQTPHANPQSASKTEIRCRKKTLATRTGGLKNKPNTPAMEEKVLLPEKASQPMLINDFKSRFLERGGRE